MNYEGTNKKLLRGDGVGGDDGPMINRSEND